MMQEIYTKYKTLVYNVTGNGNDDNDKGKKIR